MFNTTGNIPNGFACPYCNKIGTLQDINQMVYYTPPAVTHGFEPSNHHSPERGSDYKLKRLETVIWNKQSEIDSLMHQVNDLQNRNSRLNSDNNSLRIQLDNEKERTNNLNTDIKNLKVKMEMTDDRDTKIVEILRWFAEYYPDLRNKLIDIYTVVIGEDDTFAIFL